MKLFSALENKGRMNARSDFAHIASFINRCQERQPVAPIPTMSEVRASIAAIIAENGKPVCYNVCVGGNHATAHMGQ